MAEHVFHRAGKKKWISGAVKHEGRMKRAARRAGEGTQEYMREHVHSPGGLGAAARLGIRLSHMNK